MEFKTVFVLLVTLALGVNGSLAAAQASENQAAIRHDIKQLLATAKETAQARHATALREGEHDVLPALERLIGLIDLAAAIELINYESGCGAEMWEYLRSPDFELVIDDFWGEPGILGFLEWIKTNGFEMIYDMIGLLHLLMGLKLPDLPYTDPEVKVKVNPAVAVAKVHAEDECTPEDQEAMLEIALRAFPIWKFVDEIMDLLAVDESFGAMIMRLREQDVIDSYQSFIQKESALDLGRRMQAIGIPPKLITSLWNIFFGINERP